MNTWKNSLDGKILKSDTSIAKNYLIEKETSELNRLVELYINFAELQADRNITKKMNECVNALDSFLKINRYDLLNNPGKISHEVGIKKAESVYSKFRIMQDKKYVSDFEKRVKTIPTSPLKSTKG